MAVLIDTGAREKLNALFVALEERLPSEGLRPLAAAMAKNAASRAPSPSQEFNTMMYGGYNASNFGVKSTSKYYGLDDGIFDSDGRIRFYKPESLYLKNFIPQSYGVNGLTAWIGLIPGLELASGYSYVNTKYENLFGHQMRNTGITYEHHVTYPFWEAWENGGVFNIKPRDYGSPYGSHYLKPTPSGWPTPILQMTKVIPAKHMYGAVDSQAFVNAILVPKIRKIIHSI